MKKQTRKVGASISFEISRRNDKEKELLKTIRSEQYTEEELSVFAKMVFMKHFHEFLHNNSLVHGSVGYSYSDDDDSSVSVLPNTYNEENDKDPFGLGGE